MWSSNVPSSINWESFLTPENDNDYTFIIDVIDNNETFELFIDDKSVLKRELNDELSIESEKVTLNVLGMHYIRLEYHSVSVINGGVNLFWKTALTEKKPIDKLNCYPASILEDDAITYHQAATYINEFNLTDQEVSHFIEYNSNFELGDR